MGSYRLHLLPALSAAGDPLARRAPVIDFALLRDALEAALARSDRTRGGRPPYDAVPMFKVLLQTLYTLSDNQAEYQIRDRFSFLRFLGLALEDRVPDAKTIWLYREQLTQAGAIERLFERFDAVLRSAGYLAMAGQIVDATVVASRSAPTPRRRWEPAKRRPRLTQDEKATVKAGAVPETWSASARHHHVASAAAVPKRSAPVATVQASRSGFRPAWRRHRSRHGFRSRAPSPPAE